MDEQEEEQEELTETLVRRTLQNWQALEEHLRSLARQYYKILKPEHITWFPPPPDNATLSFEGGYKSKPEEMVRLEWTVYDSCGDRDEKELEFPLAWAWNPDWQTEAKNRKEILDQLEQQRTAEKQRREAAERLRNAQASLQYAREQAEKLGLHEESN